MRHLPSVGISSAAASGGKADELSGGAHFAQFSTRSIERPVVTEISFVGGVGPTPRLAAAHMGPELLCLVLRRRSVQRRLEPLRKRSSLPHVGRQRLRPLLERLDPPRENEQITGESERLDVDLRLVGFVGPPAGFGFAALAARETRDLAVALLGYVNQRRQVFNALRAKSHLDFASL